MSNVETKAANLRSGIQYLAHCGQLDISAFMRLGPKLGILRESDMAEVGSEPTLLPDNAYMARIHKQLTEPEGIKQMEEYYGSLCEDERREIGRAINGLRIR